jgi:hypothetical protein
VLTLIFVVPLGVKAASALRAFLGKLVATVEGYAAYRARHAVSECELRRASQEIDRYGGPPRTRARRS